MKDRNCSFLMLLKDLPIMRLIERAEDDCSSDIEGCIRCSCGLMFSNFFTSNSEGCLSKLPPKDDTEFPLSFLSTYNFPTSLLSLGGLLFSLIYLND
jgi:hypothetical protein